ncbi:MAG: hypothetical protein HRU18_00745 [Pseudoalteromonas sp.]|uniref:hypothetical protein n=1 Tax=Pseudoalteromonas sp. TaxID=53249 RepID=UPI001DD4EE3D|nr:hypothetical protein [Pseudoalteromonas sp.]NRA76707.1 hypothetical protein [Pseudoalteromonas sp.]
MSKKSDRIGMLISLKNTLGDIEHDAENQTAEILKSNMVIMQNHIDDILALDNISFIPADSKVNA